MGQFAGGILSGAGGMISGIGQSQAADASRNAAKANARLARREGQRGKERVLARARRDAETNRVRVAKSGVRLEGSPLFVMARNAEIAAKEGVRIKHAKEIEARLFKAQAKGAKVAGQFALGGAVLGAGGGAAQALGRGGTQRTGAPGADSASDASRGTGLKRA